MDASLFAATPFFNRFFHDSPVAMVAVRQADGRYVEANLAFARLLGYPLDELIGRPFRVLGLGDDVAPGTITGLLNDIRETGDAPLLLEARDGRALTCITSVQLERIDSEPCFFLIIQDLTEYEQTQEALRLSEDRFRLFFHSIPLPLLVFDEETRRIMDVNPAACRLYGYAPDEFIGLPLGDLLPEADRPAFRRAADPAIIRQRLGDGRVIAVEANSQAVTLDGRRVNLTLIQDVTERRAIEEEVRGRQARLRIVADVATDTIRLRELTTDQVLWSAGLKSQFGYEDGAESTHQWWADRVHPDERAPVESSIEAAFASGADAWESEYRFRRQDGAYANVLDRGRILRDDDGRPVRFLGAMVDITERLQAAAAAGRAAQEERQRLARDLHESAAQSLHSLSLLAEATRRRSLDDAEPLPVEAIGRLGELSQQALRRLRLLVYELRPSPLEQAGLAATLRHRLEAVERRAGVRSQLQDDLTVDIPPALKSEVYRLGQVILNYSLKHNGATTVSVRLWTEPATLMLEVEDDGRMNDSPATARDLATIRKRLEAMGGALAVESGDESGTTLRAAVPLGIVNRPPAAAESRSTDID